MGGAGVDGDGAVLGFAGEDPFFAAGVFAFGGGEVGAGVLAVEDLGDDVGLFAVGDDGGYAVGGGEACGLEFCFHAAGADLDVVGVFGGGGEGGDLGGDVLDDGDELGVGVGFGVCVVEAGDVG